MTHTLPETMLSMSKQLLRIRRFEESIADQYHKNSQMRCPTHLSIGQEAVAVGISQALCRDDKVVSSHRAHAHYLAKGGDETRLLAEIYGKAAGCCEGRGGSMHLIDEDCGFLGSTAIVANSIPLAAGLALSEQSKGSNNIAVAYFGEAATEEGAFYETLNFAALRNLPCLFICENNRYSVYTPLKDRVPENRSLKSICEGLGVKYYHGNGNKVDHVFELSTKVTSHIREGSGPALIELDTYRYREHCGPNYDDDLNYRPNVEVDYWKNSDCIDYAINLLKDLNAFNETEFMGYDKEVQQYFQTLHQEVSAMPFPSPESTLNGVYKDD